MTEALKALERLADALQTAGSYAGQRFAPIDTEACNEYARLCDAAYAHISEALSLLPTLRAALSAEGVGDGEIEAIREARALDKTGTAAISIIRLGKDCDTLLHKVDELTREVVRLRALADNKTEALMIAHDLVDALAPYIVKMKLPAEVVKTVADLADRSRAALELTRAAKET